MINRDRPGAGHGLPRPHLVLFDPSPEGAGRDRTRSARWSVNGFTATVQVWSAAAWLLLAAPPEGVQRLDDGSRVLLTID